MKTIYIAFFLLSGLYSFGQDEILGEWFLYSINIDGTDYDNIYENNFNIIFDDPFTSPNIYGSGVCNGYQGDYNYLGSGELSTQNCGITLVFCNGAGFESDHLFMIYCNWDNNDPEFLNYEVIGNGNNATLVITNTSNNNHAVYGRQTLSAPNSVNTKPVITLKENPVKHELEVIVEDSSFNQITYTLYSFDGKLILKTKVLENNTLDVNNLSPGLYFIEFFTDNKKAQTLKFIKE